MEQPAVFATHIQDAASCGPYEVDLERTTDADKARFLDVAKGSRGEVRSMYDVAEDIRSREPRLKGPYLNVEAIAVFVKNRCAVDFRAGGFESLEVEMSKSLMPGKIQGLTVSRSL